MTYVPYNTIRTSFHTPTILVQTETENCMTSRSDITHLLGQLVRNIDGTIQPNFLRTGNIEDMRALTIPLTESCTIKRHNARSSPIFPG